MAVVTIYGAQDDLVELDGDISAEFSPSHEREGMTLAFSDGTIIDVHYDERGIWRVHRSCIGRGTFTKTREGIAGAAADEHDRPGYTDVARLEAADEFLFWVTAGERVQVQYTERLERSKTNG